MQISWLLWNKAGDKDHKDQCRADEAQQYDKDVNGLEGYSLMRCELYPELMGWELPAYKQAHHDAGDRQHELGGQGIQEIKEIQTDYGVIA